jgi:hypothetical protein
MKEDGCLRTHRHENLKSNKGGIISQNNTLQLHTIGF